MFKSRGNVNTARYSRTNRSMTKPKVRPEESATMSKEDSHTGLPASHTGYDLIEFIGRLVLNVLLRFWRLCSAALLMLFLFYWQFGGVMVFLLLCSALFGLMYNQQDALLYYPDQPESSRIYVMSPHHFGVPYENIFFKTRDGVRINGILLKQRPENVTRVPTIVMFHGNAGNIGHRLINGQALHSFCGCNVFLVEYRGYGKSEGSISESGLYIDAESAFDYLLKRSDIDPSKIILFGRSLGGAVAINVASSPKYRDKLCALIVENTFTSIPDVAKVLFRIPILKWIPLWCHKNKYTNIRKIHRVKAPTLFLSGMRDELIPPRMMQLLFQTSISVMKRLAKFENGTHNETWQSEGYFETICQFIIEVTKSRHGPRLNSGHTVDSSVIIETNAFQDI